MSYEFVKAPKSEIDRAGIRQSLASARPDKRVEAIKDEGDHWLVRLVAADTPPFLKKDDEETEEAPKDAPKDETSDDESDDKPKEEGEDKEKSKDDGEGDALGKLKNLVSEIQSLFDELVNSSGEVTQKADEKDKALQDAHETIKQHLPDGDSAPASLEDIGPVPGGPPVDAPGAPAAPKSAPVPGGKKKRPGMAPGGVSTFTHRRTFVATHEGVDENGERISMVAAAAQLEADPQFENYEVVGIKEEDGKYVAKLELRSEA